MKVTWRFTISYDPSNDAGTRSNGLFACNPNDVDEFAELIGLPASRNATTARRQLRIELIDSDPKLKRLLDAIAERYNYEPSRWFVVPEDYRNRFFGVRKNRTYDRKDLDGVPFLLLDFAAESTATQMDGTEAQVEREVYVAAADYLQDSDVQFGTLMPFHGLCVAEPLAGRLEQADLKGLLLEPVVILPAAEVRKPLKKLSSSFVGPRSLVTVVNEQGREVEPNTEWSCYLDDGGYHPHEFRYLNSDLGFFDQVDIAMSYERTGVSKARSFRWCLVSQQFRRVMDELKVPGVRYAPVRFVD